MKHRLGKRARFGAIAVLIGVAVLVLSGCWASVQGSGNNKTMTISEKFTKQALYICSAQNPGNVNFARTRCVMNAVRQTCLQYPPGNWAPIECRDSTDEYFVNISNPNAAIQEILNGADCLTIQKFWIDTLGFAEYAWHAVTRAQSQACTFTTY